MLFWDRKRVYVTRQNNTIHYYEDVYILARYRAIGALLTHYRHTIGALLTHHRRTIGALSAHFQHTNRIITEDILSYISVNQMLRNTLLNVFCKPHLY